MKNFKKILLLTMTLTFSGSLLAEGLFFKTPDIKMKLSLDSMTSSFFSQAKNKISKKTLTTKNAIKGSGSVAYVIDGDTLWVKVEKSEFNKFMSVADTKDKKSALRSRGYQVKMRIGGINTKESVHYDSSKNSDEGKKASKYLKSWASNGNVNYDCYDHGNYGRPICAVIVNNRDIGYEMIKGGYSDYETFWGNHPYFHKEYSKASK